MIRAAAITTSPVVVVVEPVLLRPAHAAAALGVSTRTLRRLCAAGRVPAPVRLGSRIVWSADELRAWVAAGCPSRERWAAARVGAT